MTPITKDIYIEELVSDYPFSVRFLSERGVKCIACGEPIWGTLEEAAREKDFDDAAIDQLVNDLRAMDEAGK